MIGRDHDQTTDRRSGHPTGGGGTVTLPLEKQVWGDEAGSVVDRFGITWMFDISARSPMIDNRAARCERQAH